MIWVIAAYAGVGVLLGLYAAIREHQAGAVGLFVACFWPIVVAIVAFGIAAHWVRTKMGDLQ